ncbi:MAG: lipopolysaccharide heptosyltransferase II [Bryobacteraceae bacterium]
MSFQKILVRATNWVGDAVMSLPALQALRVHYPEARISLLARPWVADLYKREPFCDEVIPYEAPRGQRGLRAKWQIASSLRERSFDCAILLPNSFESALLVRLARVPMRVGYRRDGRGSLLTRAVPVPKPGEIPRHERFYYLELLLRSGLIPSYPLEGDIRLDGSRAAAAKGRELFRQLSIAEAVIGIAPGAAYGGAKRWMPERFAEAGTEVARESPSAFALFGSAGERGVCDLVEKALVARGQRAINLAGRTTLAEFIEFAAACHLFLTNDSGPMHIASALGIPTVAIFGATDHLATGPTGMASKVVREPVECSPCLLRECPIDHRCMTHVPAGRVASEALSLLELGTAIRR